MRGAHLGSHFVYFLGLFCLSLSLCVSLSVSLCLSLSLSVSHCLSPSVSVSLFSLSLLLSIILFLFFLPSSLSKFSLALYFLLSHLSRFSLPSFFSPFSFYIFIKSPSLFFLPSHLQITLSILICLPIFYLSFPLSTLSPLTVFSTVFLNPSLYLLTSPLLSLCIPLSFNCSVSIVHLFALSLSLSLSLSLLFLCLSLSLPPPLSPSYLSCTLSLRYWF